MQQGLAKPKKAIIFINFSLQDIQKMKMKIMLMLYLTIGILGAGCSTQSHIGALIPSHYRSEQTEGEDVWLYVATGQDSTKMNASPVPAGSRLPAVLGPLAVAAVGAVVDYGKSELQNEALKYEASYGQKAFLETKNILNGKKTRVLLARWVNSSSPATPEYNEVLKKISAIVTNSVSGSKEKYISDASFRKDIEGKTLASAYCFEIDRAAQADTANNPPFLIRPLWKWQLLSKAKVVSLLSSNPLSWPAGVFLKTGSEIEYNVRLIIDGLLMTKDGYPKMTTIGLNDPVIGPDRYDLNNGKHLVEYGSNHSTVGWIAIPGYPRLTDEGYFSIQLTVNENDPSNVKKTLLKGADFLDANKATIANKVVGSN